MENKPVVMSEERGNIRVRKLEVQIIRYEIKGYRAQYRKYSQHFRITSNEV